jgi:uncharacterized protein (TIGR03083 family)
MTGRWASEEAPMPSPFSEQNSASRRRLEALVRSLSDDDLRRTTPDGWTVAALLAHLAFWDQRMVALLERWREGDVDASPADPDAINDALRPLCLALEPRQAAAFCLASAEAADAALEAMSPELYAAIQEEVRASGTQFRANRALHRDDHMAQIESLLPAGAG